MKTVRIYNAKTMKKDREIECTAVILAIEFCPDKNALAVSLSNRTIVFFDTMGQNNKIVRWLHVPSTQKCLTYVQKRQVLFSAGVDGAIFAWNLNKLFSNDFTDNLAAKNQKM